MQSGPGRVRSHYLWAVPIFTHTRMLNQLSWSQPWNLSRFTKCPVGSSKSRPSPGTAWAVVSGRRWVLGTKASGRPVSESPSLRVESSLRASNHNHRLKRGWAGNRQNINHMLEPEANTDSGWAQTRFGENSISLPSTGQGHGGLALNPPRSTRGLARCGMFLRECKYFGPLPKGLRLPVVLSCLRAPFWMTRGKTDRSRAIKPKCHR